MKILLAYLSRSAGKESYASLLPVGLGYLNGVLREGGFSSRVANFSSTGAENIVNFLREERPDLLGVSFFTHNRMESLSLARMAKELNPSCFVVAGGPHASSRCRELLQHYPEIDAVVMGEGEDTFLHLAHCLSRGERDLSSVPGIAVRKGNEAAMGPVRPPIAELDRLPYPVRYMDDAYGVDLRRQMEFIITSRGCPASCLFCASPSFWGRSIRYRSPRNMIDEIKEIRDRYGLIYFSFRDDTFTSDRRRIIDFCRLLIHEKVRILWNCQSRVNAVDEEMLLWMKRGGCECIQFGVESGSAAILKRLGKKISPGDMVAAASAARAAGIQVSVYLIAGVPGETDEDLQATSQIVERMRPHDGQVSPLAYYPGTVLFSSAAQAGKVDPKIFERSGAEAFYVRSDHAVRKNTKILLHCLEQVGRKSAFTRKEIRKQKELLGFCHTTNIIAGELAESQGDDSWAEKEYREIVEKEPFNPWGWMALGELHAARGEFVEAGDAFRKLVHCVPQHAPAFAALAEIERALGKFGEAKKYARLFKELDPYSKTGGKK